MIATRQSNQRDPVRAWCHGVLGTVFDIVAQQARASQELGDELTFRIEKQGPAAVPKLSNCLGFSGQSVFTHLVHAYYIWNYWNRFEGRYLPILNP
jgi:hypothetical protein